jgi:hypothetical protein
VVGLITILPLGREPDLAAECGRLDILAPFGGCGDKIRRQRDFFREHGDFVGETTKLLSLEPGP